MAMPIYNSSPTTNIFTLPQEVIERVLIQTAVDGCPSAIATLSQTCQYFRSLVYGATDSHLWREVFLAVFDDPRAVAAHLRGATPKGPSPSLDQVVVYNWKEEFMQRMSAAKFIRRYTSEPVGEEFADVRLLPSLSDASF